MRVWCATCRPIGGWTRMVLQIAVNLRTNSVITTRSEKRDLTLNQSLTTICWRRRAFASRLHELWVWIAKIYQPELVISDYHNGAATNCVYALVVWRSRNRIDENPDCIVVTEGQNSFLLTREGERERESRGRPTEYVGYSGESPEHPTIATTGGLSTSDVLWH